MCTQYFSSFYAMSLHTMYFTEAQPFDFRAFFNISIMYSDLMLIPTIALPKTAPVIFFFFLSWHLKCNVQTTFLSQHDSLFSKFKVQLNMKDMFCCNSWISAPLKIRGKPYDLSCEDTENIPNKRPYISCLLDSVCVVTDLLTVIRWSKR